jgi:hypothetical protein
MALTSCLECKKEISTNANTCPHCGTKMPHSSAKAGVIIGGVLSAGLLAWLFGGGPEHEAAEMMSEAGRQVATDTVAQYEIARRGGDAMQICVHAGLVSAIYLQNQDEPAYRKWKAIEEKDCRSAGLHP